MGKPVILLGFANDEDDFLEFLEQEREGIRDALRNHDFRGTIEVKWEIGMTIDTVFSYFKSNHYRERIKVFHYGGHANSQVLKLADNPATVGGMAALFEKVHLVVLNGCATWEQAEAFMKFGVKAVIASRSKIPDRESKIFAIEFYRNLSEGKNLETAFENATMRVHTELGHEVSNKRTLKWDRTQTHKNEPEPEAYWELIIEDENMKTWTLATAGDFDLSRLALKQEEQKKKDLEFRLMRFGCFDGCRKKMTEKLKSSQKLPAHAFVVSGKLNSGQKWIAGNLLRDVVSFQENRNKEPLNVTITPELSNEPKFFWQQILRWMKLDRNVMGGGNTPEDLNTETEDLSENLIIGLKVQPVIFRIYNTLDADVFSTFMSTIIDCFWVPFLKKLTEYLEKNPEEKLYPFTFLIIDKKNNLTLEDILPDQSRIKTLPPNPAVTKESIESWVKWEEGSLNTPDKIISKQINQHTHNLTKIEKYTGQSGSIEVEDFFERLCNHLDFNVTYHTNDEFRLVKLIERDSIWSTPAATDPSPFQ